MLGMRLFLAAVGALAAPSSPFAHLRVLVHLDHGQHDIDLDVLDSPAGVFSSVMFDASALSFADNMAATRRYVERHHDEVVIEGACDSIPHVGETETVPCTRPDDAERFFRNTGVDCIVANLGTEHRAGAAQLGYRDDVARKISRRIGPHLCLHGGSSVVSDRLNRLFEDGVGKVNVWTALERDSSADLFAALVEHASSSAGPATASRLQRQGLLGSKADATSPVSINYSTTHYRQSVVFQSMKRIVADFLARWFPL